MRKPSILQSFNNAFIGVFWILRNERNFKIEFAALLINIFLIWFFKINAADTAIIILVSFAVLSLEMLNTAAEKICDIIQPDYDYRIKVVKDAAAGSVVVMAIAAVIIALIIYPKYLF